MHEPMNICLVSLQARGALMPGCARKIGGAERQIAMLGRALAQRGHRVTVVVEDEGQRPRETADGVTLVKLPQPPEQPTVVGRLWRRIVSGRRLGRLLRELRADVYIQMTAGAETGITQAAAAATGAPFVYLFANDDEFGPPWRRGGGLAGRLFRRGVGRAMVVVAQNEQQAEWCDRQYGRTAVAMPSMFEFGPGPYAEGRALLWLARCHRQKRPDLLLDLAERLPGREFIMAASPSEAEPDLFERIRKRAEAMDNVEFHPGVAPDRTRGLYRRAAVLVCTSDYEGLPNTFMEAADAGVAILSLKVDPGGVLSRERTGLLAGGDPGRLAELAERLLEEETLRGELVARARRIYRERHDLEQVAHRIERMLVKAKGI